MKLDLGAGQNPTPGFKSVDIAQGADYVVDLFEFPWPFKARSVNEITTNHLVEHIPHRIEGHKKDGFLLFFDECYRILKRNGTIKITCPYVKNDRAFWDPTHTRYIHETNFSYLNKEWREFQQLDHYPVECNFEIVVISAAQNDSFLQRTPEAQQFANTHYWNALSDLYVELKALK